MTEAAQLAWLKLDKQHRQALSSFTCTDPPKRPAGPGKSYHRIAAKPYEFVVQSYLRGRLKPPCRPPWYCLGAMDGDELVAVAHFELVEVDDVVGPLFYVHATAVARPHQGRGIGTELMRRVVDEAVQEAIQQGASCCTIETMVHRANAPSLAKNRRLGFVRHPAEDVADYECWRREISDLPGFLDD